MEKQRASLNRIQANQQHLLSLIEDVLSFVRVEAGRVPLDIRTVPVRVVADALEVTVRPELQRKEISFSCDACDAAVSVQADPEKLRQILLNFVANAIKFTDPNGHIRVGAEREGGLVRIWVSDTGIGIPPDQIAQVFEPFFQVESGPTRRYPGIGLGLAIARDLARAMGGEVRLESTVGKGSTVSVLLPVG